PGAAADPRAQEEVVRRSGLARPAAAAARVEPPAVTARGRAAAPAASLARRAPRPRPLGPLLVPVLAARRQLPAHCAHLPSCAYGRAPEPAPAPAARQRGPRRPVAHVARTAAPDDDAAAATAAAACALVHRKPAAHAAPRQTCLAAPPEHGATPAAAGPLLAGRPVIATGAGPLELSGQPAM
ncbi:hypothetical protein IWQ57_005761, partial [Coemansia nantahalensis]